MNFKVKFKDGEYYLNGKKLDLLLKPGARSCRVILTDNKYVVKLSAFRSRYSTSKQNTSEFMRWGKIKEGDKKYFAATLAYGRVDNRPNETFLVQPLYKARRGRPSKKCLLVLDKITYKYGLRDLCWCGGNSNWFVNKNTGLPLIYDYAI